jgi:hypothetical protein
MANHTKGQFYEEHCSEDGILTLLLEGLRQSGAAFKIRKRFEPDDRRHTPVELDRVVGEYCNWGEWKPTRYLEIVTRREIRPDGKEVQMLKSMFPVSPARCGF